MNRKSWPGFVIAMGALCAYGCPAPTPGNDVAAVVDASDIPIACADGFVPSDPTMDAGTCHRVTTCDMSPFCPSLTVNNPMEPRFVIAQLDISSPAVLAPNQPVGRIVNDAIVQGKFFWGISVDVANHTMRTGALLTDQPEQPGAGYLTNQFHFLQGTAPGANPLRWDPVQAGITIAGDVFSTSVTPIPLVTVPIYGPRNDAGVASLLAELPLRNTRMHDVVMTANRNCIGLAKFQYVSCLRGRWDTVSASTMTPYGVLEADVTVTDADAIIVVDLPGPPSLCALIAGTSANDCASVPQANWRTPPETTAAGPGWHLTANFSGYAVNIEGLPPRDASVTDAPVDAVADTAADTAPGDVPRADVSTADVHDATASDAARDATVE